MFDDEIGAAARSDILLERSPDATVVVNVVAQVPVLLPSGHTFERLLLGDIEPHHERLSGVIQSI